jgi:hypothetical protein
MGIVINRYLELEFSVAYVIIKKDYKLMTNRYIWKQQKIV